MTDAVTQRARQARSEGAPWPITLAAAAMVSVLLIGLYVIVLS